MNHKRKRPRDKKVYRNGIDGRNCSYCGSNWYYSKLIKKDSIKWENVLMGPEPEYVYPFDNISTMDE